MYVETVLKVADSRRWERISKNEIKKKSNCISQTLKKIFEIHWDVLCCRCCCTFAVCRSTISTTILALISSTSLDSTWLYLMFSRKFNKFFFLGSRGVWDWQCKHLPNGTHQKWCTSSSYCYCYCLPLRHSCRCAIPNKIKTNWILQYERVAGGAYVAKFIANTEMNTRHTNQDEFSRSLFPTPFPSLHRSVYVSLLFSSLLLIQSA